MENRLVTIFQDTQKLLWENEQIFHLTTSAVMCTRVFPENFETTRIMRNYPTMISVMDEMPFAAARRLVKLYPKVAVLNFANAVNPGGGVVYGADAQEESLCRCSNLYPCLTKPEIFENFYHYNNQMDYFYSDRIIYSENVTVFKTETKYPEYTDEWFQVDVISCPAPNLNGITVPDYGKLEKVLNSRIKNIMAVAEAHGVHALVLGDFGCGVLLNPPELVARVFYQQLVDGGFENTFREVVFAVNAEHLQGKRNLDIFKSILSPWQKNPLYGKKVSILGDSISTFWGSNPEYCKVYYEGEHCLRAGIYTVETTWWMQVLHQLGGKLLINNSYSGSKVSGGSRYAGNGDLRTSDLHDGQITPDVIFIFMGINDYGSGVPLEPVTDQEYRERNYYSYFKPSYEMMLWKLRQIYPDAEIYCATLPISSTDGKNMFPFSIYGIPLDTYNNAIRSCAWQYDCKVVDLQKMDVSYDSMDGVHPTALGMSQIADAWIRNLLADFDKRNKIKANKGRKENKIRLEIWLTFLTVCSIVLMILVVIMLLYLV